MAAHPEAAAALHPGAGGSHRPQVCIVCNLGFASTERFLRRSVTPALAWFSTERFSVNGFSNDRKRDYRSFHHTELRDYESGKISQARKCIAHGSYIPSDSAAGIGVMKTPQIRHLPSSGLGRWVMVRTGNTKGVRTFDQRYPCAYPHRRKSDNLDSPTAIPMPSGSTGVAWLAWGQQVSEGFRECRRTPARLSPPRRTKRPGAPGYPPPPVAEAMTG
ncbi:hypothetical protein [Azospirillum largimobile]